MPVSPSFGDVQCILDGSLFFFHLSCICASEMYLRIGDVFVNGDVFAHWRCICERF